MEFKKPEIDIQSKMLIDLQNKYKNGDFKYNWESQKTKNKEIQDLLKGASKNTDSNEKNLGQGEPDLIYYNPETRMLILGEIKNDKRLHIAPDKDTKNAAKKYAVNGVIHYMSFFKNFDVFGIAISGDQDDYLIDQYYSPKDSDRVETLSAQRILNEIDYQNIIGDNAIGDNVGSLSTVLNELNKMMDSDKIRTQDRPLITAAVIFGLIPFPGVKTDFEKLKGDSDKVEDLLSMSIAKKMSLLKGNKKEIAGVSDKFVRLLGSYQISNTAWSQIVNLIDIKIMPIIMKMRTESYHDFSGEMYRVLLRYTSGDGKVLGQVLTPKHVANLMLDLAQLKRGDSILDPACGTGIFLVNGMNRLISLAKSDEEIAEIKNNDIYGIEVSKDMYFLTLVNLMINGETAANLFIDEDTVDPNERGIFHYTDKDFKKKPTKVVMNPPYLSQSEMWKFIIKATKLVSEKVVAIVSTSIFTGNTSFKRELLKGNSVDAIINMPSNIFQSKSSSSAQVKTSIIVINVGVPNSENVKGTFFYDLKDDGLISSKSRGRYDGLKKWNKIKDDLMNAYKNMRNIPDTSIVVNNLTAEQEWNFNNFNTIVNDDFLALNEYLRNMFEELIEKDNAENKFKKYAVMSELDDKLKDYDLEKYVSQMNIEEFPAKDILTFATNKLVNAYRVEKYADMKGNITYVSAANQRNGSILDNTRNILDETVLDNAFTWNSQGDGGAGLAFFHPYKFIVGATAFVFVPKENLDLYQKLFLAFAMSLEHKNRYFGHSLTKTGFKDGDIKISLPSKNKKVDWEFIEKIMRENPIAQEIGNYITIREASEESNAIS